MQKAEFSHLNIAHRKKEHRRVRGVRAFFEIMINVDDDDNDEDEDDKTNGDQAPSIVSGIQMIQNTLQVLDYGSFPHKMGIAMTNMMMTLIISLHLWMCVLV